jgi:hypothetical protein
MSTSESIRALRRANPRGRADFAPSVEATADLVLAQVAAASGSERGGRRRLVRISAAGVAVAAAVAAVLLTVVSPGSGPGVENAAAAFERAATVTAASAERSGTAAVRITHGGETWAAATIRWNGDDLSVRRDTPRQFQRFRKAGDELRVVDGMMYTPDPEGGWAELGPPSSVDPGSGTTPAEFLAAVREDVGGVTLRRVRGSITGLTSSAGPDGSTVYRGLVASGVIARETGFKEGEHIRVLPFGYVAHDEAADAAAPLRTAVTVGADGVVRELALSWGTGDSVWRYTVTYSGLGETPAPVAPAKAEPLRRAIGRG